MKKNKKNEELQSRREFFKRAAKGALPILVAGVLAGMPSILNAAEESPMGCNYGCNGSCQGCRGTCTGCSGCGGQCRQSCSSGCAHTHY